MGAAKVFGEDDRSPLTTKLHKVEGIVGLVVDRTHDNEDRPVCSKLCASAQTLPRHAASREMLVMHEHAMTRALQCSNARVALPETEVNAGLNLVADGALVDTTQVTLIRRLFTRAAWTNVQGDAGL